MEKQLSDEEQRKQSVDAEYQLQEQLAKLSGDPDFQKKVDEVLKGMTKEEKLNAYKKAKARIEEQKKQPDWALRLAARKALQRFRMHTNFEHLKLADKVLVDGLKKMPQ